MPSTLSTLKARPALIDLHKLEPVHLAQLETVEIPCKVVLFRWTIVYLPLHRCDRCSTEPVSVCFDVIEVMT